MEHNAEQIQKFLEIDPIAVAEKITGTNDPNNKALQEVSLVSGVVFAGLKQDMLKELGDSNYGNSLEDYLDILGELGFKIAAQFPFVGNNSGVEEMLYVFAIKEKGIVLVFDTYAGERVNGGNFYYCWKPSTIASTYGVTSSGSYESESIEDWRHDPRFLKSPPDDAYWSGNHDCREAISFRIQQLKKNGTFYPNWPKTSRGQKMSGLYFMSYMDWKHPDYKVCDFTPNSHLNKIYRERFSALPKWCQDIIGWPELVSVK